MGINDATGWLHSYLDQKTKNQPTCSLCKLLHLRQLQIIFTMFVIAISSTEVAILSWSLVNKLLTMVAFEDTWTKLLFSGTANICDIEVK